MPTIRLTSETKERFDAYATNLRDTGKAATHSDALAYLLTMASSTEGNDASAELEALRERTEELSARVVSLKRERDDLAQKADELQSANEALTERLKRAYTVRRANGEDGLHTEARTPANHMCPDSNSAKRGVTLSQVVEESRAAARALSRQERPW